jgi:hypothetical protein
MRRIESCKNLIKVEGVESRIEVALVIDIQQIATEIRGRAEFSNYTYDVTALGDAN